MNAMKWFIRCPSMTRILLNNPVNKPSAINGTEKTKMATRRLSNGMATRLVNNP